MAKRAVVLCLVLGGCWTGDREGGSPTGTETDPVRNALTLAGCRGYQGITRAIPGTIQAEDFDEDDPASSTTCSSHSDTTTGNNWNHYRTGVNADLQPSSGNEPGTNVGLTGTGEWLKYTVNVTAAGQYTLEARVSATATGRSLDILLDSQLLADNWAIPNTGNYQTYASLTKTVTLTAGVKVLQVLFNTGSQNLTWIKFTSQGCTPESDATFCTRQGKNCGAVTALDNCNVSRTASCGSCTAPDACTAANVCCTAESDATFCSRQGKNCGAVSGNDNCGAARTVPSCGPCDAPATCTTANVCCAAESDAAFCSRLDKNCGSVTGNDACGISRTADCGSCAPPGSCSTSNVCCAGETDAQFCSRLGKNCGSVTGTDICAISRTVDCGSCAAPGTCTANICCLPESDAAFCSRQGKTCGSVTAADNCGASRTAACGSCTAPSTCSASNVCVSPGGCLRTVNVTSTATLASAVSGALPGDCVVLANGNYTFPTISKTGTVDAPITIKAANRDQAVVNSGVIHLLNSAYVVLEGLRITTPGASSSFHNSGSTGMILAFTDSHHCRLTRSSLRPTGSVTVDRDWIVLTNANTHHNRIDHNDFGPQTVQANMIVIDGTGREEPYTPGNVSQFNQVDHNYFHDISYTGGNGWEAVRVGRSWQGPTAGFNVVEYNLFNKAHNDPETVSIKSSDNTVRFNTMRATSGEFTLRHGNRNKVHGNYILGVSGTDANSGSKGFRVYGADHRIYNNYIHVNGTGIQLDDGASDKTEEPGKLHYSVWRAWVYNNTIIGKTIKFGGSKAYNPRDCRAANNIVGSSIQVDSGATVVQEGNTVGNPLTLQSGIYRNTGGSSNNAANASFYGLAEDIDGQPRSAPDRGADENSTAPVTTPGPLTTSNVGPNSP